MEQWELRLIFKEPPPPRLRREGQASGRPPDELVVRLHPTTGIRLLRRRPAQRLRPTPSRSTSTWSSPSRAVRDPTPYEVLLHAAMVGQQHALHPPGQHRGDLADLRAADREAAQGPAVQAGLLGTEGRRPAGQGVRRLARTLDRLMSPPKAKEKQEQETMPQSAAMPSPFPPIADYAFLSNCHTGALVAPDGAIDWLCVPRFDSPSIFGTLLDREAGSFRFGPFGINVPSGRIYEPGTNILNTTWHTPTGWAMGTRRADHRPDREGGRGHSAHAGAGRRGRPSPARSSRALHGGIGRHGAALRAGLRLRAHPGRVEAARASHRGRDRRGGDRQAAQQHAARG